MAILQQPFATLFDLEVMGIASDAIQAESLRARRRVLKGASGTLEIYLRKRNAPPFAVELDPDFWDASGMTGGALVTYQVTGPTLRVQDIAVQFPAGGTVGSPGPTLAYNFDDGAYGTTFGPPGALALSGVFVTQGYTFTIAPGAVINAGDVLRFSLCTDPGLSRATVGIAAMDLIGARGVDPKTQAALREAAAAALAWAKDIGKGEGELEADADTTPAKQEGGHRMTRTRVQQDPYAWVRDGRRRED
jgi:hypothetical protein